MAIVVTEWAFDEMASAVDETNHGIMRNLLELLEIKEEHTVGAILVYRWIDRTLGDIGGFEIHNTGGNAELRTISPPFVQPDMSQPDWMQRKKELEQQRRDAHNQIAQYFDAWLNHALQRKNRWHTIMAKEVNTPESSGGISIIDSTVTINNGDLIGGNKTEIKASAETIEPPSA